VNASCIVTFIADDRPGLVEQLSGVIRDNGGNWLESRLSQLGGKFAGLILVSLPMDNRAALEDALRALEPGGLSVSVTSSAEFAPPSTGSAISLSVLGPDRPGIVREISRVLARQGINVTKLDTSVTPAPMSAEMIFNANISAWIPDETDLEDLRNTLDAVADDMTLDIDLERVG